MDIPTLLRNLAFEVGLPGAEKADDALAAYVDERCALALEVAAENVRKVRDSRRTYWGYSDDSETRARNEAVSESVQDTLTEVADGLELAAGKLRKK